MLIDKAPPALNVVALGKRSELDVKVLVAVEPTYKVSKTDILVVDACPESEARDDTERVPVIVVFPELSVPVVERFSSPKEIAVLESVMLPDDIVSVSKYVFPDTVNIVDVALPNVVCPVTVSVPEFVVFVS